MLNSLRKFTIKAIRPFRKQEHEWFSGDYETFEEARSACTGYDEPSILQKVRTALLKVKNGEAVYERDSVIFDEVQYSLPLLTFLLYVASASNNNLNILDFGGSLGSSYFQNRKFLNRMQSVRWNIVEQPHFVACGKQEFQNKTLRFFDSIDACVNATQPNALLLSSVLPYLSYPYSTLQKILAHKFDFILIDRTPFFKDDLPDRLTIEHVPAHIYQAEYPAWFFNKNKFVSTLKTDYTLFETMPANDKLQLSGTEIYYLAMLFVRKSHA